MVQKKEIKAEQKFVRMSPQKVRFVVNAIKKLTPEEALDVLPHLGKRAAEPLIKVIKTALANAKQEGIKEELVFKEIQIGDGPRLKRGRPVSRGVWHPVLKRMCHIRVVLKTKESQSTQKSKKKMTQTRSKTKERSKAQLCN